MAWWKLEPFRPTATNSSGLVGSANDRMQAAMRERAYFDRLVQSQTPETVRQGIGTRVINGAIKVGMKLSDKIEFEGSLTWLEIHIGLDVLATIPYGVYWASYSALDQRNRWAASKGAWNIPIRIASVHLDLALVPLEALGYGGDMAIDVLKVAVLPSLTFGPDSPDGSPIHYEVFNEGFENHLTPYFELGPTFYLPGRHCKGCEDPGAFDWEW